MSKLDVNQPRSTWPLGLLATGFFSLHALCQIHAGRHENLLWACHVADLCVGLGLLVRWPTLNGGGVLLLAMGIPLWLINLCFGGAFYPTSILTHLGGFTIGLIGLRRLPTARYDWLTAVALVATLLVASRAVTSPARNVNLAFSAWHAMGPVLNSPELHVLTVLGGWAILLWSSRQVLIRFRWLRAFDGN
jgi:hypothetical protein